jgi:hypothetical protein
VSSPPNLDRHFVPLRVGDLVNELARRPELPEGDRELWRRFAELVQHTYHFEQHQDLLRLKDDYAPYNPGADTKELNPLSGAAQRERLDAVFTDVAGLAKRANFRELTKEDLGLALKSRTAAGLNMDVDLDVFDKYALYVRGTTKVKQVRPSWWPWSVVEEEVEAFQRLLLVMKLRPHPRLGKNTDTEHVHVKAFKDIPKADVEMLIPGAKVKFTQYDKGMISFPLLTALLVLLWTFFKQFIIWFLLLVLAYILSEQFLAGLTTERPKDAPRVEELLKDTVQAAALFSVAMLSFGAGYRAWFAYQHKKAIYNLKLTESLYFQSVASNAGVLTWLLDEAEEQECREVLLAYFFLLTKGNAAGGWTAAQLDTEVEVFLQGCVGRFVDFEVDDALGKLERFGLVERDGEQYRARPLSQCLGILDERWDNYFPYHDE